MERCNEALEQELSSGSSHVCFENFAGLILFKAIFAKTYSGCGSQCITNNRPQIHGRLFFCGQDLFEIKVFLSLCVLADLWLVEKGAK